MKKLFTPLVLILIVIAVFVMTARFIKFNFVSTTQKESVSSVDISKKSSVQTDTPSSSSLQTNVVEKNTETSVPIERASERVTKKPFGIYIDPKISPVQPERFHGYHTGSDFETFPEERDSDVAVRAVCSGTMVSKRHATGYGGVVVESCELAGQSATVVYGHLALESVSIKNGDTIKQGSVIGLLGTGYSADTDGERKHLHLGIHKGSAINILGYVADKQTLSDWIDPCTLFCKSQ
jgi:murein DD-endopeptidase MepM/ murein hydrolase activator NlpD